MSGIRINHTTFYDNNNLLTHSLTHCWMMKMITKKVKISQNRNVMSHFLRVNIFFCNAMWSCDYNIAHVRSNLCHHSRSQMEFQSEIWCIKSALLLITKKIQNICIRKWQKQQHGIDRSWQRRMTKKQQLLFSLSNKNKKN